MIGTIDFNVLLHTSKALNCVVSGSSGVELASGLHWFIKKNCQGMITWKKTGGKQIAGEREGSNKP